MDVDQAIAAAEAVLPGHAAPDGEEDPRWQAMIAIAGFLPDAPEPICAFVLRVTWPVDCRFCTVLCRFCTVLCVVCTVLRLVCAVLRRFCTVDCRRCWRMLYTRGYHVLVASAGGASAITMNEGYLPSH